MFQREFARMDVASEDPYQRGASHDRADNRSCVKQVRSLSILSRKSLARSEIPIKV